MRIECNDNECWTRRTDPAHMGSKGPEATRFFRSRAENTGKPGVDPSSGEHFYFGRCELHARPDHLNHDLLVEVTYEEYIIAGVMQS